MSKGLKLGHSRCECPTCLECFNSVGAFERHRVGVNPDGSRMGRGRRRCLEPLEMLGCGMVENLAGYWTTGANPRWSGQGEEQETPD